MTLLLSLRAALQRRYGADGVTQITTALDTYVEAIGAQLAWLDELFPVPSVTSTQALTAVRQRRSTSDEIDAVLIVGNESVVPYWQFPNPVTDRNVDPDPIVYTDSPYGADENALEAFLAPELAVGRLPDGATGAVQVLVDAIDALTAQHVASTSKQGGGLVIACREWADPTENVEGALPAPATTWLAPPAPITSIDLASAKPRCLYVNLHGRSDDPGWKTFDQAEQAFVDVVTPAILAKGDVGGAVCFVENCYGAYTIGKTAATSCAMQLIESGASALVGATGLAYGSHLDPSVTLLENADDLARHFFSALVANGARVGDALVQARQLYRDEASVSMNDPFKQKTLLQFVLLGDPSLS